MAAHEQHVAPAQGVGQAFALGFAGGRDGSGITVVIGDAVVEQGCGLQRHGEAAAVLHAQRRGVGHMGVQHAADVGPAAIDRRMDMVGDLVVVVLQGKLVGTRHDAHQIGRGHLAPMQAVAIQEKSGISRQTCREMVADAFGHVPLHGQAESRGKVATQLRFLVGDVGDHGFLRRAGSDWPDTNVKKTALCDPHQRFFVRLQTYLPGVKGIATPPRSACGKPVVMNPRVLVAARRW
ncbi:MAG: hypothetical protein O3B22_01195 [Proteobacteria bacterium]|nr:hypothetical protein [Pseudomonadota bacterium]MDA1069783.1 hypothetical protein [Pseudomonadota bacterium]